MLDYIRAALKGEIMKIQDRILQTIITRPLEIFLAFFAFVFSLQSAFPLGRAPLIARLFNPYVVSTIWMVVAIIITVGFVRGNRKMRFTGALMSAAVWTSAVAAEIVKQPLSFAIWYSLGFVFMSGVSAILVRNGFRFRIDSSWMPEPESLTESRTEKYSGLSAEWQNPANFSGKELLIFEEEPVDVDSRA